MSTLKVNTVEKYSGGSGVTIKDSVTIAPDSGVKNLDVSGTITSNGILKAETHINLEGNLVGNNSNVSGINQVTASAISCSGNATVNGTLSVGNPPVLLQNIVKAWGEVRFNFRGNSQFATFQGHNYNFASLSNSSFQNSTNDLAARTYTFRLNFDTPLTNTNYMVVPSYHWETDLYTTSQVLTTYVTKNVDYVAFSVRCPNYTLSAASNQIANWQVQVIS